MEKKLRYIKRICLMLSIGAVLLAGCAGLQPREGDDEASVKSRTPIVSQKLRFEDIPVPYGFSLSRTQSFIYQTESSRIGRLRYVGRIKIDDVIKFYKEQMALYNWELENIVEYEYAVLYYKKSSEQLTVTVMPLSTKTVIDIVLTPRGHFAGSTGS